MNVYIENEYNSTPDINYEDIILSVVKEAVEFVKCPYECEVNVTLVDNNSIQILNKEQRDMDKPTDVLSFPMIEYPTPADFSEIEEDISLFNPDTGELMLGDIVISYDKVLSQATEYNHSVRRELAFLTAHSMLHLFGFDHMSDNDRIEMEENQNIILKNLGITRED